jgi:hypothetical protein
LDALKTLMLRRGTPLPSAVSWKTPRPVRQPLPSVGTSETRPGHRRLLRQGRATDAVQRSETLDELLDVVVRGIDQGT